MRWLRAIGAAIRGGRETTPGEAIRVGIMCVCCLVVGYLVADIKNHPPASMLPVGSIEYVGPYSKGGTQVCVAPFDESVPANDMAYGDRGVCHVFTVTAVRRAVSRCESYRMRYVRHGDWTSDTWRTRWPECLTHGGAS